MAQALRLLVAATGSCVSCSYTGALWGSAYLLRSSSFVEIDVSSFSPHSDCLRWEGSALSSILGKLRYREV